MKFDARAAKLLKEGEHLTVEDAPGLRLVRSATRSSWVYRYRSPIDGRMRQAKLGGWPAMSAASAGAAWEALRAARDAGRDPAQERRAERQAAVASSRNAGTVGELLDAYLAGPTAGLTDKGQRETRRLLDAMAARLRPLAPSLVTRAAAYDLINGHAATPVVAAQLRRHLGAAWDWGHDSGRLAEDVPNWWRKVLRGKLVSKGKIVGGAHQGVSKRVLTPAEVGAVLGHLPHISATVADLLVLYLWTGCRGAELVAMEGREVAREADGWWWTIPRSKLKMAAHPLATDLRVPLMGRALKVVQARVREHGERWLFPAVNARSRLPHMAQKAVGVEVWSHMPGKTTRYVNPAPTWPVANWAPHDLRRTVRTQLAALGCPSDVAEAVLGHIQPGVEGIYNRHGYDAERRMWLRRLAASWEAVAAR